MATWENWAGNVACQPCEIVRPRSEAEIVEALARAETQGLSVRVAGSGHSFTPVVATDGMLFDLSLMRGIARLESEESRAWVRAGTKLSDLGGPLHEAGFAMENLGDVDVQALGGALGTGTHGTGHTLPNLSARVSGLRLLRADGELLSLRDDTDPEGLRAARVSLGALGIITAARIELLPAYRLHEKVLRLSMDEVLENLEERIQATRHFEFFWYPQADRAEAKSLHLTDEVEAPDRKGERIDWSHRILPSERDLRFTEMEYAVPAEHGRSAFLAVRERIQTRHPDVAWPVEYRTLRSDDAWLSTARDRETVTISVHQDGRLPHEAFFSDVEPIFAEFGGRPHWGKVHRLSGESLADVVPGLGEFAQLREEWDPAGRFLNPHLRSLFLGP
jgi:FAD/FMN-containing dehydrogenase